MRNTLFWSFLLLLVVLSAPLSAQEFDLSDICNSPRVQEANTINFKNLEVGQTYKLVFPHNPESLDLASLFNQSDVKALTHSNQIVYLTALKSDIDFYYPGINLAQEVVNCGAFYIEKLEGSLLKSMMGIMTEKGAQPSYLVTNVLLGDFCLDVSNISITNNSNTYGTFSNGGSSIGIEDGLILATGNISAAEGPNTGNYTATGGSNSPDSDIAQITSGSQFNVVKLEFDFVPDENTIQFDYVFASEEYCFYVNSTFNDAFGFFLSGPGIAGPYTNNAINMATLPNGTPVSINNVNWGLNSEAYVTNSIGGGGGCTAAEVAADKPFLQLTGFNGFTIPLVAQAEVIPCETYHIKIVIADIGDAQLDSGVFLGSTSFVSGEADSRVNITAGSINDTDNIAEEGCENAYIAFEKDPPENEVTFSFEVLPTGTATEGVDYESFPSTYTIPAGVAIDTLWIDIFGDLITEGIENVEVRIVGLCDCLDPIVEFLIEDPPTYNREYSICEGEYYEGPNGPIFTEGEFFELVETSGGCDSLFLTNLTLRPKTYYDTTIYRCFGEPLEFQGETFDFAPALEVFILDDENYVSCDSVIQLNFQWIDPVLLPAVDDTLNCENETVQLYITNSTIPDNITYFWVDPDGNTLLGENPDVSLPGIYQLISTLEIEDQLCENFFPYEIEVFADSLSPLLQPIEDAIIYCNLNSPIINSVVSNIDDIPDVVYLWTGPNGFTSDADSIMPIDSGMYNLQVTSPSTGCIVSTDFQIVYDNIIPEIEFTTNAIGCNATSIPLNNTVDIEGGSYMWSGPNSFTSTEAVPNISETGIYTLTYSLSSICTNTESIEITADDSPPEYSVLGDTIICNQGEGQLTFSSLDYASFHWTGPNGFYSELPNPIVEIQGNYTAQVLGNNGCTDSSTVSLSYIDIIPDLSIQNDTINCYEPIVNLTAISSFTGLDYNWQGPSGFSSLDASPPTNIAGTYYITITNEEGCNNVNQLEIVIDTLSPDLNVSSAEINCSNPTVTLLANTTNPDVEYSWSGPNGISSNTDILLTEDPGQYSIIVIGANGCDNNASTIVNIDTISPSFEVYGDTLDCNTSLGNIQVEYSNTNYNITWLDFNDMEISNAQQVEVDVAGQYQANVINTDNGCMASKTVYVAENENTPDLELSADTITCENKLYYINATSSYSNLEFNWSGPNGFNSTNKDITILESGIYDVEIISDIGCIVNRSISVFEDTAPPSISSFPDTLNCDQTEINLYVNSIDDNVTYS